MYLCYSHNNNIWSINVQCTTGRTCGRWKFYDECLPLLVTVHLWDWMDDLLWWEHQTSVVEALHECENQPNGCPESPAPVKGPVLRSRQNRQANPSNGLQKTDAFLSSSCSAVLTCQWQKAAFVSCVFISAGVTVFNTNLGRLPYLETWINTLVTQGKLNSLTFPCIMGSRFRPV